MNNQNKNNLLKSVGIGAIICCGLFLMYKGIKARHESQRPFTISGNPHSTNTSLFKEIVANQTVAAEEIDFWGLQVSEHALFMYLGFTHEQLKNKALELHKKLEAFRSDFKAQGAQVMNQLLPLLEEERELQLNALNMQKSGEWIGWLFPSLLKHMTMELDYFVAKLNSVEVKEEDEIAFWEKEASDRIGVIAHLLDPSEKKLVAQATEISQKYFDVPESEKENFKQAALTAIKEVNEFSKKIDANKNNIEHIINQKLAEHELREGKRGEAILAKLK